MMTMSRKLVTSFCAVTLAGALRAQPAATPAPAAADSAVGPRIQFATPVHDFGRARAGEPVKYTYVFTNTGDALLEVKNVQPQCGCTTAGEFSRKVEPGQAGSIAISFNTSAYNGQVFKTVTVTSNDKKQPTYVLQLKGIVWKPIETIPQYAVLTVPPDSETASMTVQITNHMDEPLELFEPQVSSAAVAVELKTNAPGKAFEVVLKTVPPLAPNNIAGRVTLKTTSTNMPTLDLPFWVNIQPAITVLPPQVYLQQAPLAVAMTPSVNIQNNSTKPVSLSDVSVNVPGVDAQIREVNPGHTFSIVFNFPAGFEVPRGQQALCTVKSSHPHYPLIKIPIMQAPRPAMAPFPNVQGKPPAGASAGAPVQLAAPTRAIK
jgi:Protein of unknown function (DUF1573)